MKRQTIAVIVLFMLMLPIGNFAKADIVDANGAILAKAPYIQSPTNTTYGYNSLTLDVNFYADWFRAWDYSINYSLDGKANQTLSLEFSGRSGQSNVSVVSVPIFNLSEGTHHLIVYIQLATTTKTYYDSQNVVFTIAKNNSILTNSPTPSAPELPGTAVFLLLLTMFFFAMVIRHRKKIT
jgi:hypothetical protein